jgi:ElaA protein
VNNVSISKSASQAHREIVWSCQPYSDLSRDDLYAIIQARLQVFAVEQAIPYQDLDGFDLQATHLIARDVQSGAVAGYLRILPPGSRYSDPSIGRVLTMADFRGCGLGRELMQRGIDNCRRLYPEREIHISAQAYLQKFYESLGFKPVGSSYIEEGIAHLGMQLST